MPVREIPIQTRSKSGYFYSRKNRRSVAYESLLEKKCFLILEFDDDIVSYEEQPLKIENYVPDVLAVTKDGKNVLIEVKYSEEAENPDEKLSAKFDALKKYCGDRDWTFKIFTEKDVNEPYFSNISLIYRYVSLRPNEKILSFIRKRGKTDIKTLLETGFEVEHIYALLAKGKLKTDLRKELSLGSRIRINDA